MAISPPKLKEDTIVLQATINGGSSIDFSNMFRAQASRLVFRSPADVTRRAASTGRAARADTGGTQDRR